MITGAQRMVWPKAGRGRGRWLPCTRGLVMLGHRPCSPPLVGGGAVDYARPASLTDLAQARADA